MIYLDTDLASTPLSVGNINILEHKDCVIGRLNIWNVKLIANVIVYAHNQTIDNYLNILEQEIQELGDYSLIIGGDFNESLKWTN